MVSLVGSVRRRQPHALGLAGAAFTLVLMAVGAKANDEDDAQLWRLLLGLTLICLVKFEILRRLRSIWWTLVWPVTGLVALALLGLVAPSTASLESGLIALMFVYVGVTLPPRTCLVLVVPALLVAESVFDLPARQAALRLSIATLVWLVGAELPARLAADLEVERRSLVDEGDRLKSTSDELRHLTRIDPLTGLLNRRGWDASWQLMAERGIGGSVAILDLDFFKTFNDSRGHLAGDRLLTQFAEVIASSVREADLVCRWGGEEFAIALPGCDVTSAAGILAGIRAAVPEGQTCSIGLTSGRFESAALARADAALYEAKERGRDRTVVR